MKNLLIACALCISISGCGAKLYSYRKTVKIKSAEASGKRCPGAIKTDFTVKTEPSSASAVLNIVPNTLYLTTKPLPAAKKKNIASLQPGSSSMVR